MPGNEEIRLADLPEFAVEEVQGQRLTVAPVNPNGVVEFEYSNADIVDMLQVLHEQNTKILEHVAGIEAAFKEVAETTSEAMGMLGDSPLGSLMGKLMGR